MEKFEQFKSIVGMELLDVVIKKAAMEAIKEGDWKRVRAIADFAILNDEAVSANSNRLESRNQLRANSRSFGDLDLERRMND